MSDEDNEIQSLELKDVVRNILEECRMVLPGIQALFGFQLVAIFNQRFSEIAAADKQLHIAALFLTIVSIAFLMAPAAYHRQVERNSVSQRFVNFASRLLCVGMAPLVMSLCIDVYVVTNTAIASSPIALFISTCSFMLLIFLWYIIPRSARHKSALLG